MKYTLNGVFDRQPVTVGPYSLQLVSAVLLPASVDTVLSEFSLEPCLT